MRIPLVSMGAERRVKRAQTRERGPPSALAEIQLLYQNIHMNLINILLVPHSVPYADTHPMFTAESCPHFSNSSINPVLLFSNSSNGQWWVLSIKTKQIKNLDRDIITGQ